MGWAGLMQGRWRPARMGVPHDRLMFVTEPWDAAANGRSAPQYPIESVDNALKILLQLAEKPSLRMTDVSRGLGVASSTAHRLLAMLQYRGFVRQNPATKEYEPDSSLFTIAFAVMNRVDVRERARPVLEKLSTMVGETVHLGRLDGTQVDFLDSIESRRAVRVGSRLGMSMPAHCTSTGKALLAAQSPEEVRRLYPEESLLQLTEESIGTRSELEAVLERVRANGYAWSSGESEEGVGSVSVAIGVAGGGMYALNISAPTYRMSPEVRAEFAAALKEAAAELAGYYL
jgi:IclR family acetate operon transcriptional repressor